MAIKKTSLVLFEWTENHFTSKKGTKDVMHVTTANALGDLGEIVKRNVFVQLKGKYKNEEEK